MDTTVDAREPTGFEVLEALEDDQMAHLDVDDYLLGDDGAACGGVEGGSGAVGDDGDDDDGGGDDDDDDDVFEVAALMMDAEEALHGCTGSGGGDGSTSGESMDYHHGYAHKDIHVAATFKTRTKRRHSNGHNKRKRSSFSRAAQISQRLQNEAMTGAISDEDIRWDPNDGLPHAGKWPIEEERYAYMLIRNFENGTLEDCLDGTTLRSYLAKTLRCAPMRVSKKFAGKCVGSKTYVRCVGEPGYSAPVRPELEDSASAVAAAVAAAAVATFADGDAGSPTKPPARPAEKTSPSPPKYALRKNAGRSYDDYDLDEDEDNEDDAEEMEALAEGNAEDDAEDASESTSREDDPTDPCSGSSSDGGMSDMSGSPRAKRHKSAATAAVVAGAAAPAQSPRGRRVSVTALSSACRAAIEDDFMVMVNAIAANAPSPAHTGASDGANVAEDEYDWRQALSYLTSDDAGLEAGDDCGIGDGCGIKRSNSAMSLAMLD